MCEPAFDSVSALMTFPSVVRLRFIFLASLRICPSAPVFDIFSEPAKSTKKSFPVFALRSVRLVWKMVIKNIMCDLEDLSFMLVLQLALFWLPMLMSE